MDLKKIVLLILLFTTFAITGCGEEKQVSVSKPEYIYKDIVTKHGDSFRIQSNMFEEIKKSVATIIETLQLIEGVGVQNAIIGATVLIVVPIIYMALRIVKPPVKIIIEER